MLIPLQVPGGPELLVIALVFLFVPVLVLVALIGAFVHLRRRDRGETSHDERRIEALERRVEELERRVEELEAARESRTDST